MTEAKKFDILIVEDSPQLAQDAANIFKAYPEFAVRIAIGATDALLAIKDKMPDAVIIERCIVYGTAREELENGLFDIHEVNAGIQLLKRMFVLQGVGSLEENRVAVFFMHTDAFPMDTADLAWLDKLRVKFYTKPFETLRLEADVCERFSVSCKLPAILLDDSRMKEATRDDRPSRLY